MTNHRIISEDEGRALASANNLHYFETSAKDDTGFNEVFDFMSTKILSSIEVSPDYLNLSKEKLSLQAGNKKTVKKDKCCG